MRQNAKQQTATLKGSLKRNTGFASIGFLLLAASFTLPIVYPSQSLPALTLVGLCFIFGSAFLGFALVRMIKATPEATKIATLEQALAEEKSARLKAQAENAAKSRLLGTVSHDIRTPLSGISGMCHLLAQSKLSAEQRNYLSGIRQSSNALAQLVDDLLDFVSLEAGRFQLRPQDESLRTVLEGVVEMLAHRAHEKGIEISSWVSSDIPDVLSFDPARLRQVLFNIIGNAVKFTQEGGVYVEASVERSALVIRVTDTGPGMTREEQERIFGEFEQVGNDRDKTGGTGLGLSISARIVAAAGGDITVTSDKGRGATFTLRLPMEFSGDFGGRYTRSATLKASNALIICPPGPTAHSLIKTIETLGGQCTHADDIKRARAALESAASEENSRFTDIIADHRLADDFTRLIAEKPALCPPKTRKVFLVNPENRLSKITGIGFDSWLVRPLRERSLVDVLLGRMKGIELRDPLNDNRGSQIASRFTVPEANALKVLVAEDDPVNALLARATLTKAGHRVQTVEDYQHLIEAATNPGHRPDILITDLSMPGGNGLDAIEEIRSFESNAGLGNLPVIVVSGRDGDEVRQMALDAGASAFLHKPADPAELSELVSRFGLANIRHG
ncbi:hybrid sensor histidine kinase/response regulator [Rhizobium sp. L1K21]|uniref:hybrid sensor histidine kinase/response regulator n=1 Tax=Rhizobium sp. L1K21 TaxID=2954933 RepID=UPI002092724A|nr:ATP-binding protein [Rhizobium sp. L1K21]MCO6187368.1 ATP-binding protein [Rhizobium sp. L1K21]